MKYLILLSISLLVGCAGQTTKTPLVVNGEVVKNWYGGAVYTKEKLSRTAVLSRDGAEGIKFASLAAKDKVNPCALIMEKTPTTAAGEAEQFRSYGDCVRSGNTNALVGVALNRPQSDVQAIAQQTTLSVKHVQDGLTNRIAVGGETITGGLISIQAGKTIRNGQDSLASVGISAAENSGNTTVGDISLSSSQHGSADSNDGGAGGAAGELGIGGAGGNGSGVASNDRSDTAPTNIIIGDNNNTSNASDNGRIFTETSSTQQLDASANGAAVEGSNIDQLIPIDDNTGNQSNQPENGSNNDPDFF